MPGSCSIVQRYLSLGKLPRSAILKLSPRVCFRSLSSTPRLESHEVRAPIDEELIAGDRLKYFHPTGPGDVLDGRLKIIAKLGFGGGSTVWLAENVKA